MRLLATLRLLLLLPPPPHLPVRLRLPLAVECPPVHNMHSMCMHMCLNMCLWDEAPRLCAVCLHTMCMYLHMHRCLHTMYMCLHMC